MAGGTRGTRIWEQLPDDIKKGYSIVDISRLARIWGAMKSRCYNKNVWCYPYYGGRGITICDSWRNSFLVFASWALAHGYRGDLTIDRVDVNLGYSPENCEWKTRAEQMSNTRKIEEVNNKILGQRFGLLTVLSSEGLLNHRRRYFCHCDCGRNVSVNGNSLLTGNTTSCGCLGNRNKKEKRENRIQSMIGKRFTRWTVLRYWGTTKWGDIKFLCRCTCGNNGVVVEGNLKRGVSASCGCLKRDLNRTGYRTPSPRPQEGKNDHEKRA